MPGQLLATWRAGYTVVPVTSGASGAAVCRLEAPGAAPRYLKQGSGPVADEISREAERLEWAAGKLPVPRVLACARDGDEAALLTTALDGVSAAAALEANAGAAPAIVRALAAFLRALHALPVAACPFEASATVRLAAARQRLEAGLVDDTNFDPERAGQPAEAVWATMVALLPLPFARVVTHGDCTLDNVFVDGDRVTGCLDVGRLGVADPYQDLAILANSLADVDADLPGQLFAAYGLPQVDARRCTFHQLLDEFF